MKGVILALVAGAALLLFAFGSIDWINEHTPGWLTAEFKMSPLGLYGACYIYHLIAMRFERRRWEHERRWHDPLRTPKH